MRALPGDSGNDANDRLPEWVKGAARFTDDPLSKARSLRSLIERNASESERLGRLSDEAVRALCGSGLLGLLIPRELGGIEADPDLYIDVIEELSYADGSFGWVTMATTFTIMGAAAWLGPVAIAAMFDSENGFAAAGQIAPTGIAEKVSGGTALVVSSTLGADRSSPRGSSVHSSCTGRVSPYAMPMDRPKFSGLLDRATRCTLILQAGM